MIQNRFTFFRSLTPVTALLVAGALGGCSQEEQVLDVEAPGMNLEVTEDTETGEINVEGEFGEN